MTGAQASMGDIFATLDQAIELLPAELLEEAKVSIDSAIAGLQVLSGSGSHEDISEVARNAVDRIQAAQLAVHELRKQIEGWKERNGGG
ncbi:hypothetical protein AB0F72_19635 [Actinoplanes sp. NPDC023936]|uniref:hypothetical protein n=1 Tax=Actinoplanes sp. NPDC023936 TaxID=3154910 RepID=UPI0033DC6DDE